MKIGLRVLLGYFIIVALAAWLLPKLIRFIVRVLKKIVGGAPEGST